METLTMNAQQLIDHLLDQTDGPVNQQTVIYRGIQLAQDNSVDDQLLADAIFEALEDIRLNGDLPSNEFGR